jgi:hypothetical protein
MISWGLSLILLWWCIWMTSLSTTRLCKNTCNISNRFCTLYNNTSYMPTWKMLLRHGQGWVPRIHCWWSWSACQSSQDLGHLWLASPDHTHRASKLPRPCQFLSQVRVGIIPHCIGP